MNDPRLLEGAIIQRVDAGPAVLRMRVRTVGATYYVLVVAGKPGRAVGLLDDKPWKGSSFPFDKLPEAERIRLRRRLEGARIEALGERGIVLARETDRLSVEAESRSSGKLRVSELLADAPLPFDPAGASEQDAWLEAGRTLAQTTSDSALASAQQNLARALLRATQRIRRRIEAIRGDLARIAEADGLAELATLFIAEAARAKRGAKKLVVTDWSTGEPQEKTLDLDPARTAREQVDALFKRARRLKLGAAVAERRLSEAVATAQAIEGIAERVATEATLEGLEALTREARSAAPRDFTKSPGPTSGAGPLAKKSPTARSYRVFVGSFGDRIFVGRGAAHNDALTFHVGRPHDLFLHAKGRAGAHVIVPLAKNQTCSAELLVDAAHLAAHFSEAREEAIVDIEYTPRRYLRKPKGSAPGFVILSREKVLVLRVQAETVTRLLAAEELE